MSESMQAPSDRLEQFLSFLKADPDNPNLLADAAASALDARHPEKAWDLLAHLATVRPLAFSEENMMGVAALQTRDFEGAKATFGRLLEQKPEDPALRFNAAWAHSVLGEAEASEALLDEATTSALPQAAMLHVNLLHSRGAFEEAKAKADGYLERHPEHPGLNAVCANLAIDVEDWELARQCAERGGDHVDALTTRGTLTLNDGASAEAIEIFDRALTKQSGSARAMVGRGLAKLNMGDLQGAAADLDQGAEGFGKHLGSWIAAGWAHFVQGEYDAAEQRFTRALELDDNFAEAHGALAAIDVAQGRRESAEERMKIALRLDRQCLGAALARILMLNDSGDCEAAKKVLERAMAAPVGENGESLGQAMTRIGFSA